jgi:crotonobetainyl-CoA:carnitine CoA-transferase CaiB-like acyl-CoA transferase
MWYRYGQCDAVNAMHSVFGVLQALWHRDRTGEGQMVETNIVNGGMVINSDFHLTEAGPVARPMIDAEQRGIDPLYRLYRTSEGWIQLVCLTEQEWVDLASVVGGDELLHDDRFATPAARRKHADQLAARLEAVMLERPAAHWSAVFDQHGIPAEVSRETYATDMFDDQDAVNSGWVVDYQMPQFGLLKQIGMLVELSETPGRIAGPPPLLGQHTVEILAELGYDAEQADILKQRGVVAYPEAPAATAGAL